MIFVEIYRPSFLALKNKVCHSLTHMNGNKKDTNNFVKKNLVKLK